MLRPDLILPMRIWYAFPTYVAIEFQIKGCLENSASILGDLLSKFRKISFHEFITGRANLHFLEITNLLSSIKLHRKLGVLSPPVLGQNLCNLYSNSCFYGSGPGNNPLITDFTSKAFDCCNGSTMPNPP